MGIKSLDANPMNNSVTDKAGNPSDKNAAIQYHETHGRVDIAYLYPCNDSFYCNSRLSNVTLTFVDFHFVLLYISHQ